MSGRIFLFMKYQELLDEILEGNNPVCLHAPHDQDLVNNLCDIIRYLQRKERIPKVKIIARPNGAWQLEVDGELSHKAPYDHPIIFEGVIAFTSYYSQYGEAAYILGEKLEHTVEDKSLERFTSTQQ